MKSSLNIALLAAVFVVFFVVGCTKNDMVLEDSISTTVENEVTTADLNKCKIRRIYVGSEEFPYEYTGLFSYNKAGNPYSILFTGHVRDYYFFYDSKNRLTSHIEYVYGIAYRHYYRHNTIGQIIIDSAIYPGSDLRDTSIRVSHIEYDSRGRVVKETIVNTYSNDGILEPTRRPTYTYDNRGNIGVIGWKSSSYDYKINPLRQNPIFQFILRNYSMNNAAKQKRYNSLGLPTTLTVSNDPFFGGYLGATKIIYDCQ